mmetsp:Transcript_9526/g.12368  ORF Transcript_9526/g.12368 Transcript_9526/m.12368 type:complete len:771 (-) Transcript_9526:124-2436(-)
MDSSPILGDNILSSKSGEIDGGSTALIVTAGVVGILFAVYLYRLIASISLGSSQTGSLNGEQGANFHLLADGESNRKLIEIYEAIREGADSFLFAEYRICMYFIIGFGTLVLILTSRADGKWDFEVGALTAVAFVVGALTSIVSGYLGMKVAVFSNARTTVSAMDPVAPWTYSFNTAFRAGGVMGFSLCGLALLTLYTLVVIYNSFYAFDDVEKGKKLFECVAGFGLGGSSIALFGRVGGGIYTKAADVGADLAGKVVSGIPEDDPRNPATIADNVGDNVGDVAGMGSDLFGSFAEASCAALVVAHSSQDLVDAGWRALMFPLMISALGIFVCLVTSFLATHISPVRTEHDVEKVLKVQLGVTTILMTAFLYPVADWALPKDFEITNVSEDIIKGSPIKACVCVWMGLWAGCLIGFITEYYTSHSYQPTREVAQACETGAATNIIYGLALGYKSVALPVVLLALVVYVTFTLLDMFGVALAALGMLGTLATCLSIDVYGPVCDNAGGIAEMAELPEDVREKTDALDAAGNTTAAIGKGFAIGSACLVGLALFGAFIKRTGLKAEDVTILSPIVFAFLLIGAMLPYFFSAMTMKSVGIAAAEMVKEVAHQFDTIPGLLAGTAGHAPPDHASCIKISTEASLREMVAPAILVMSTPIISGILFGTTAVCGLLAGAISSSVQMAISASNTGGAWDNAKKWVEKGQLFIDGVQQPKGSECHKAAVVGDTVGDPLKDTSGPALNIVMKLMAILSLVFADFFVSINHGKGLIDWHS